MLRKPCPIDNAQIGTFYIKGDNNTKNDRENQIIGLKLYIISTQTFIDTRLKPVEHGYVFSMAVGTIGEWLKLVPFLLGDLQLVRGGGAGSFLK